MGSYISIEKIMEIYSISLHKVNEIIKENRIDTYKGKNVFLIKFADFHKIYTSKYNPTLFSLEGNSASNKKIIKDENYNLLSKIFSEPIECKKNKLKRVTMVYNKIVKAKS